MAFSDGFNIKTLSKNHSECFYRIQNNSNIVIPKFLGSLTTDLNASSPMTNANMHNLVYNGSLFLHNITGDLTYCTSAVDQSINFVKNTLS